MLYFSEKILTKKIYIANDIKIGAGAIVTKSFYEEGITICGVPAKMVNKV